MEPKLIRADDVDAETYIRQHPELDPQQRDVIRGPQVSQEDYRRVSWWKVAQERKAPGEPNDR